MSRSSRRLLSPLNSDSVGMVDGDRHMPARVGGRASAVPAAEGAGVRAERELLRAQARLQRELEVAAVARPVSGASLRDVSRPLIAPLALDLAPVPPREVDDLELHPVR